MGIKPEVYSTSKPRLGPAEIGHCVYCCRGVYSDQEWGRAPSPMIGKAHAECIQAAAVVK